MPPILLLIAVAACVFGAFGLLWFAAEMHRED
jgi:hypothetical protein